MAKSTIERLERAFGNDLARLKAVGEERGDTWQAIGAIGLFLETRTMYLRLRNMIWECRVAAAKLEPPQAAELAGLLNALQDLRCYAALLELAVEDGNMTGHGGDQ